MKKHISKLAALMLLGCSASYAALVSVPAGDITTNTTWSSTNEYILEGIVYVKNATLTIQPGTIIRGQPRTADGIYNPGTLVITKSAKISAVGTATNPIIFTTACLDSGANSVPRDTTTTGGATAGDGYFDRAVVSGGVLASGTFLDATPKTSPLPATAAVSYSNAQITGGSTTLLAALGGGIIILGDAPTNVDGKVANGIGGFIEGRSYIEGLAETADTVYGGDFPLHNSGKLSYVSIRHGGAKLSSNNEINGLTLGGVGAGTQIDHIDIYVNFDDGVEVFGGTVNLKYLNISFAEDDGFDVDQGWTGAAQFIFVLQHPAYGDSLAELDGGDQDSANSGSGSDYLTLNGKPVQNCVIANGTWVGRGSTVSLKEGLRARAGFGGEILNNVVIQASNGLRIDADTAAETDGWDARSRAILGEFKFRSNTLFGNTANTLSFTQVAPNVVLGTFDTATAGWNNVTVSPGFKAFTVASYVNPVGLQTGMGGNPGAFGAVTALPNNPFFTTTTYRGAFSADKTANLWTNGWTTLNVSGVLVSKGNL